MEVCLVLPRAISVFPVTRTLSCVTSRCFNVALIDSWRIGILGWRVYGGAGPLSWHSGTSEFEDDWFHERHSGCLPLINIAEWIVWSGRRRGRKKENEIKELTDSTKHAYDVLWLAKRVQHLWFTGVRAVLQSPALAGLSWHGQVETRRNKDRKTEKEEVKDTQGRFRNT